MTKDEFMKKARDDRQSLCRELENELVYEMYTNCKSPEEALRLLEYVNNMYSRHK